MNNWYPSEILEEQRRLDRMAQAEKERLIRQITARKSPGILVHRRLLARFGSLLVVWGTHLQGRYDELVAAGMNPTHPPQTSSQAPPC